MKKAALGLIVLLVILYGVALAVPLDPEEQRAGTRLSGALAEDQAPDWSSLYGGPKKIWVQTRTWYGIPHSVTTISFVHQGQLYVPCGRNCDTKRWPRNVARDPRVVLKIDGKRYERQAVRISDESERARLVLALAGEPQPNTWVFRTEARQD